MTAINITQGDSKTLRVTITEDDGTTPVDLSDSVLKFSVRKRGAHCSELQIGLKSYDDRIDIDDPANGRALVYLYKPDTFDMAPNTYRYDVETTRRGTVRTSAGSVSVVSGSRVMTGAALDLSSISVGDLIDLAGVDAANSIQVTIQDVGGSGRETDPGAGNLLTDYDGFATESGIAFTVYRGNVKTPAGLVDDFIVNAAPTS